MVSIAVSHRTSSLIACIRLGASIWMPMLLMVKADNSWMVSKIEVQTVNVNVCVERPVGAIGRLKGAGESASDSRHGFSFVVFFAEEMGLWILRENGVRGEGK